MNIMLVLVFSCQRNEVQGSYHMENKGLVRALSFLKGQGLTVGVLVTDKHPQCFRLC